MYLEHFGLRERPFSDAPDSRFIYLGEHHERALAHLRRSVQAQGGVGHLIGPSGIGKTTICRLLLNQLPERVDVALILNPVQTRQELLSVVCDELGIAYGTDAPSLILGDSLYRRQAAGLGGRSTVVIVDEAQSLSLDVLEQLYMLSSLEIDGRKLLGIILIGEPWLIDLAARTASSLPSQSTSYHLPPFTENETCAYVRHRMAVAGSARDVFDVDALRDVHRLSSGVPRRINTICARALLSAVAQRRRDIDRATVLAAVRAIPSLAASVAIEPSDEPRVERIAIRREPAKPPAPRARRALWPWIVAGGLVLNAAMIGAFVLAPPPSGVVPPKPETRLELEPPAPGAPATVSAPPPVSTPQAVEDPPPLARAPETTRATAPPAMTARPSAPSRIPATAPGGSIASTPSDESPRQRRRRERTELRPPTAPPPVSSQVQPAPELELKIEMLVWSAEPQQRMVYINGQKYVEGEKLENGAVLERIEPDAIVVIQERRRLRLRAEAR